jgi:hypothetical protein
LISFGFEKGECEAALKAYKNDVGHASDSLFRKWENPSGGDIAMTPLIEIIDLLSD